MTKESQTLQPEDLTKVLFLGEVQLSPDAQQIFYDLYYINREKNSYQGEIWQLDVSSKKSRKLTNGPRRDANPRLSPNGTKLAFLSDRGGDEVKRQVYLLDLAAAGEAAQLTTFQTGVSWVSWLPDNRHLLLLLDTPDSAEKAANWHLPETAEAKREKQTAEEEAKRVFGQPVKFERLHMRADGRPSLIPGDSHSQLWLLDTAAPGVAPRQLTSGPFNVSQPTASPDGHKVVFSSTRNQQQADFTCISDLWLVDLYAAETTFEKLTTSFGPAGSPAWSPDGKTIAFVAHTNPKDGSFMEQPRLWKLDIEADGKAGEAVCLSLGLDRPLGNMLNSDLRAFGETPPVWSADSAEIYFAACSDGSMKLFRVPRDGSADPTPFTGNGHIYAYSFGAGQVAFSSATPQIPGDIFLLSLSGNSLERLTTLNDSWLANYYIAEPQTIRVPSVDGTCEIEGWIMLPPAFDKAKKYPLVLEIHGGPHTAYGHSFNLEFQTLAGQGQVVLFTNPRGSVSYGHDFGAAIYNDWGHHDYDDVMAALDYVIGLGYVDTARLGVTGGSYGGYLTNWIVTHTDRFKAALTQRCVSNMLTMYTLSDISFSFVESEFEGDIWSNPRIWERSPMAHANKCKTPLLMLHSETDFRCPIEQAEEFYFALKRHGCEVELVRTPNESHNLSRNGTPDHRIGRLRRIKEWFETRL